MTVHTFLGLCLYDLGVMATLTYLVEGPMSTARMVPCACAMLVEYCAVSFEMHLVISTIFSWFFQGSDKIQGNLQATKQPGFYRCLVTYCCVVCEMGVMDILRQRS